MSYIIPSGQTFSIVSETYTVASGQVSISMTMANKTLISSSTYQMDVTKIGSIEADFNYIESAGNIDDFKVNIPRFEFEVIDSIRRVDNLSSNSLINMISLLSGSDIIVVKMTFNGASDYYYTTRDNCEFSFSNRSVKISALHPIKYGLLPPGSSWGSSYFNGKYVLLDNQYLEVVNGQPTGNKIYVDTVLPRDLIEGYLYNLSESSTIVFRSSIYPYSYNSLPQNGTSILMPADYPAGALDYDLFDKAPDDFSVATTRVKQYALGESAIVGNMLGYGFYVPRFDKSSDLGVPITSDDIGDLGMDINFKHVRFYDFEAEHTDLISVKTGVPSNSTEVIYSLGDIDVSVFYPKPEHQATAAFNSLTSAFETPGIYTNYPGNFESDLILSFKKIFRISQSASSVDAGTYISGTIFGVNKLKPYQYLEIPSGVHPLVDNKDFRPSYLKYDLVRDEIKFEAYEF